MRGQLVAGCCRPPYPAHGLGYVPPTGTPPFPGRPGPDCRPLSRDVSSRVAVNRPVAVSTDAWQTSPGHFCGRCNRRRFPAVLLIEVIDSSPLMPHLEDAGADDEHGRGLMLTEALSADWGYFSIRRSGKCVFCISPDRRITSGSARADDNARRFGTFRWGRCQAGPGESEGRQGCAGGCGRVGVAGACQDDGLTGQVHPRSRRSVGEVPAGSFWSTLHLGNGAMRCFGKSAPFQFAST